LYYTTSGIITPIGGLPSLNLCTGRPPIGVPEDQNVNLCVCTNLKLSKPGVHTWRPFGRTGD